MFVTLFVTCMIFTFSLVTEATGILLQLVQSFMVLDRSRECGVGCMSILHPSLARVVCLLPGNGIFQSCLSASRSVCVQEKGFTQSCLSAV